MKNIVLSVFIAIVTLPCAAFAAPISEAKSGQILFAAISVGFGVAVIIAMLIWRHKVLKEIKDNKKQREQEHKEALEAIENLKPEDMNKEQLLKYIDDLKAKNEEKKES